MALIKCSECGGHVSDKAASCPHCGAPISRAKETIAAGQELRTIQQTSKKFKAHSLISITITIIGFLMVVRAVTAEEMTSGFGAFSGLLFLGGALWYVVTNIRIWWHHS
jgi:uncharacterized membrane protein YvbJ